MPIWGWLSHDDGQDAYEYMLAAGTLVVVLVAAFWAFTEFVPDIVGSSCPSVDTASSPAATDGSCVVEGP